MLVIFYTLFWTGKKLYLSNSYDTTTEVSFYQIT